MKMLKALFVNLLSVLIITTSYSVSVQAAGIPSISSSSSEVDMDKMYKIVDDLIFVKGKYVAGVGMIGLSFFLLGSLGVAIPLFLGGIGVLLTPTLTKDACKKIKCNKGIFDN